MAIKKNLLWDPLDRNNPQTLFNTKNYYADQDFVYGSDLNLILAPLTHALQFYPLYNDDKSRNAYNTDTSLLIPYNAGGYGIEQFPTLFRLTYQGDYNGDVNVVFDNSKSGYKANVLIDGNYYGTIFQGTNFIIPNKTSLNSLYDTVMTGKTVDGKLKKFVRNTSYGYDYTESYTEVYGRLRMNTVHSDPEDPSTTVHTLILNANNERGTLVLKPGTVATMSDLDTLENNIKPSSDGWHDIDDDYQFNTDHSPIKAVFLIEVRNITKTDVQISTIVAIDTTTPEWNVVPNTTGDLGTVIIGFGAFTNNADGSVLAPAKDWDVWAKFKYESGVSGKGHYLEFDGNPRTPSSIAYDKYKVTKLFDL